MKVTIYTMHGMGYDYLAAVDEEGKTIYFFDDSAIQSSYHKAVADLKREDITDVSAGDAYTLDEYTETHSGACWQDMRADLIFQQYTAHIINIWDMDV